MSAGSSHTGVRLLNFMDLYPEVRNRIYEIIDQSEAGDNIRECVPIIRTSASTSATPANPVRADGERFDYSMDPEKRYAADYLGAALLTQAQTLHNFGISSLPVERIARMLGVLTPIAAQERPPRTVQSLMLVNRTMYNETSKYPKNKTQRIGIWVVDPTGRRTKQAHMEREVDAFVAAIAGHGEHIKHVELGFCDNIPRTPEARRIRMTRQHSDQLSAFCHRPARRSGPEKREFMMKLVRKIARVLPNVETVTFHHEPSHFDAIPVTLQRELMALFRGVKEILIQSPLIQP